MREKVLCQQCASREAEVRIPVHTIVDDATWEDVKFHLAMTAEQGERHRVMAFNDFMGGIIAYVDSLRQVGTIALCAEPLAFRYEYLSVNDRQSDAFEDHWFWEVRERDPRIGATEYRLKQIRNVTPLYAKLLRGD